MVIVKRITLHGWFLYQQSVNSYNRHHLNLWFKHMCCNKSVWTRVLLDQFHYKGTICSPSYFCQWFYGGTELTWAVKVLCIYDAAFSEKHIWYHLYMAPHFPVSTGQPHRILILSWPCHCLVFFPVLFDILCYCKPSLWLLGGVIGRVSQT